MTETNFTPTKVDKAALEDMTEHEKYLLAGKIAKEILDHVEPLVKPGATAKELCLIADNMVFDSGAMPAFPLNVSVNHHAAHYTAGIDDTLIIRDNDVVKIDLGVQVDGYIADTARTIIFSDGSSCILYQFHKVGCLHNSHNSNNRWDGVIRWNYYVRI